MEPACHRHLHTQLLARSDSSKDTLEFLVRLRQPPIRSDTYRQKQLPNTCIATGSDRSFLSDRDLSKFRMPLESFGSAPDSCRSGRPSAVHDRFLQYFYPGGISSLLCGTLA